MFPIRGSFLGPGGNLEFVFLAFDLQVILITMNKSKPRIVDMRI
jgi:hypothetical protein